MWPDKETIELRLDLIREELRELEDAIDCQDIVGVFDALLDLEYVVVGAGITFGLPMDEGMEEVQRSNMSKLGEDGKPIYRADGKVLKGPAFTEPRLAEILFPSNSPAAEIS